MAFRATNLIPDRQYEAAKQLAANVRRIAQNESSDLANGGSATRIIGILDRLVDTKARFQAFRAVPGIAAHAQEQENDPTYDVAAEFTAMLATIDAAIAVIVTTFPAAGSGHAQEYTINADGSRTPSNFTGAQLSGLRTALDDIAASIS